MGGDLEEIFRLRTNGNGYVQQEWDDILLKREILQLIGEGRVREVPCKPSPTQPGGWGTRRFHDVETGDIYEYSGPWERGGPRFYKVSRQ